MCTEARGLIRALLQPDPTVRLTAEQTLLHPWVKAMASACKQRALTDKTPREVAAAGATPETAQKPAKTNTTESLTDKTTKCAGSEGEIAAKKIGRRDERQTAMSPARGVGENKPAGQQPVETSHIISPGDREHTPVQHKPEVASTDRREAQVPGPKLLNAEFHQLDSSTAAQAELLPQLKTQATQKSQQSLPGSTPPTNPSPQPSSLFSSNRT